MAKAKKAVMMGTKFKAAKLLLESYPDVELKITTYIPAAMAAPGPPLGPMLGQKGINIAAFCKDFNERTSNMKEGIPLPSRIKVKPDRSYSLVIHQPPGSYFLKQAAGCEKGASSAGSEVAGMISLKHIYEIAKIKIKDPPLEMTNIKDLCKMLIQSAVTCGIKVVKELNAKDYADFLAERKAFVEQRALELEEKKKAKVQRTSSG